MNQEHARDLPARPPDDSLFGDVATLIEGARGRVAATVNAELTMLCWGIGRRIREDVLDGVRGEYGQRVVQRLADRLTARYGRGYSKVSLLRMVRFAEVYPEPEIVSTLWTQLTWSHCWRLIALEDPDEPPIGLILCTSKGPQQTALLGLDHGEIRAARYITVPLRDQMQRRLAVAAGQLGAAEE